MYKLWVNVDENGIVNDSYGGYEGIIQEPLVEYQYYFDVNDEVFKNLGYYKVVNGELVPR